MNSPRPIEIIGGGLAGLSLGLALRGRGVPVTLHEAARYPRAKVCGEFIAGLDAATQQALGLEPFLAPQRRHHHATWHRGKRIVPHRLPTPAIGVSRHWLDTQLARAFVAAGGDLREGSRVPLGTPRPGLVLAYGRRRETTGWLGLKFHVTDLGLTGDLEMHLGAGAYVGLAGVEGERVNVCGLFEPRRGLGGAPEAVLLRYLRASGLDRLAERLEAATIVPDSQAAVAGVQFGRNKAAPDGVVAIGDAFAAIPPFTGHGMAMALQGAALAVSPLVAWSEGRAEWSNTVTQVQRRLHRKFRLRLTLARLLHPWLLTRRRQQVLGRLQTSHLLPLRFVQRLLHN